MIGLALFAAELAPGPMSRRATFGTTTGQESLNGQALRITLQSLEHCGSVLTESNDTESVLGCKIVGRRATSRKRVFPGAYEVSRESTIITARCMLDVTHVVLLSTSFKGRLRGVCVVRDRYRLVSGRELVLKLASHTTHG